MAKRVISIILAVVLVLGLLGMVALEAFATSEYAVSDACVDIIKRNEGFCEKPMWDYSQYTIGYGTYCPDDMLKYYQQYGITKAEAETLLRNYISVIEDELRDKFIAKYSLQLNQGQYDALVSFSYNCGTGWIYHPEYSFTDAIIKGTDNNEILRCFALWCSAGGEVVEGLLRRRLCEANMYLNGQYSDMPPSNYGYVYYNANGGTTEPRTQGFDAAMRVKPFPVAKHTKYIFGGWYTSRTGGTKVEFLDKAYNASTLYAHWVDASGNEVVRNDLPVTVTVINESVNIRKGPGTNYANLGKLNKGDKITIIEVQEGGRYSWGNFGTGWVALQYTDFETVIYQKVEGGSDEPDIFEEDAVAPTIETEPPEEVTTAPTEPDTYEEDAVTFPTEPVQSQPETVIHTGTVNVSDYLRVREGPSTGHAEVARLNPGDRVEILETKSVGSVIWGRISQGWISLEYVTLDDQQTNDDTVSSGSVTVTIVNCTQLRVRSGPGTDYDIAGYVYAGDVLTVTEQKQVGNVTWGKISTGWISFEYVQINSEAETPKEVTGTINVSDCLRVRSGPGTSYAVSGYLYPGEKVTVTQTQTVDGTVWGKVSNGWISMEYVQLDTRSVPTRAPAKNAASKTVTATTLHVRAAAGTENAIVGYLYKDAKITILETTVVNGVTWGKISTGWISMEYVK